MPKDRLSSSKKVKHQGDAHGMPETLGDLGQRWLSLLATSPSPTHLQRPDHAEKNGRH